MYTRIEEVIHFVFKAFKGKKRIKEDIDLAFHSICVGTMLKDIGMGEDIVITGYLHDIIEDTNYDYEYLKNKYGSVIATNVMYLSENREIMDFKERKIEFINRLDSQDNDDLIVVEIADKLHNLLSDYELYKKNGKDALATLSTTYDMNKWYYLEMLNLFERRVSNNKLLDRYKEIVSIYFN
ncbi:MAG: HD domain-containing protein [Bacilli bacterium]|nr:HD domain-containing protein [Bacilli bacterium]